MVEAVLAIWLLTTVPQDPGGNYLIGPEHGLAWDYTDVGDHDGFALEYIINGYPLPPGDGGGRLYFEGPGRRYLNLVKAIGTAPEVQPVAGDVVRLYLRAYRNESTPMGTACDVDHICSDTAGPIDVIWPTFCEFTTRAELLTCLGVTP